MQLIGYLYHSICLKTSPYNNHFAITYLFYPFLLVILFTLFFIANKEGWNLATVFAWMAGGRFLILITVEFLFPAENKWKMTWPSFKRDLKYMLVNGGISAVLSVGMVWLALDLSRVNSGILTNLSVLLELVLLILTFEFFQYWFHRWSHEGKGIIGTWLWKIHVAHHLPDKVYLLMHPVGHPINLVISMLLVNGPLVVLGAQTESIFLFNALMGLQGLVSHFNVNVKAGWLNYVLVGTELHRFHHSANVEEAKNYGVLTPFWDLVFGTFRYHPQNLPAILGVDKPEQYPDSSELYKILAFPFK